MSITKKGMMIEITADNAGMLLDSPLEYKKPHVERVRKAMLMQIEEMQSNPKWVSYVAGEHNKEDSQNGKNNIPNMGGGRSKK